ncbi:syntaxin-16 isoform X4 [Monodon monoceros]|uniref:syntaxin-16 isoform X4 n=1 Tax=Monodon monoceros TaxID=40151 RepID=UPI0010F632BD|nr:syntaxin-16 isoform X4 [Monodon monoceros]
MATRRLTDAFLLLRNNSIQNRQLLAEQLADDRMALVSGISLDPEAAVGVTKRLPPKWVDGVDEIQYDVGRIKQKMKELASLHDQHLNRPTLDDSLEQEHAIEITTQEITQVRFSIDLLAVLGASRSGQSAVCLTLAGERRGRGAPWATTTPTRRPAVSATCSPSSSTGASVQCRHCPARPAGPARSRKSGCFATWWAPWRRLCRSCPPASGARSRATSSGFTDDQLALVGQSTLMVDAREREVGRIVQSICDLNEIFRDLGAMIAEQGTVLDRIDYNVEQSCIKTEDGLKQLHKLWQAALSTLNPSPTDSCPLYLNYATVAALPSRVSRHNSPSAAHFVTRLVRTCLPPGTHRCILMVCERSDAFASACALARAFPLFTQRSGASRRPEKKTVTVEFFLVGQDNGPVEVSTLQCLTSATEGVRLAARIVDTPCNEMNTDTFLEEIKKVGKELGIVPTVIRDEELKTRGFGGIYGVGKAALHPPALAVLSHTPVGATQTIAWVGKGIVYDTGGLSMKGKTTMPGMKRDCGGAAAVLGAFRAAVKQGFRDTLHAVFCLAENSVGPSATRPDDIHLLYSGKTVEINNTDAEGRLVLADGVSYACKDLGADIILDIATLTGAQGIATGKYHAAVLTNSAEWEAACMKAGRQCGDLVHPLVYCPELHFSEFTSAVADMKNSVADRDNGPSSCAGLFIASHIGFDWPGVWVHLDIAAPVHAGERATGFGVALLLALFGRASEDPLLNLVSPLGCEVDAQEEDAERDSKKRRLV